MSDARYQVIVYHEDGANGRTTLSIYEMARQVGCHPDFVEWLARYGVIDPLEAGQRPLRFSVAALDRLRRGLRLRQDLGVPISALGLVLDLLERIDRLESERRFL